MRPSGSTGDAMTEETREHAHELIDQLPEAQLTGLVQFLETIVGTLSYPLANAPLDDEPLTEEDRRAVAEAVEWLRHNEPIPHNQLLSEFGLTIADWERWPRSRYGEKYPGAMAKRIIRTDQGKADVRAIEQKTALPILKTLARDDVIEILRVRNRREAYR